MAVVDAPTGVRDPERVGQEAVPSWLREVGVTARETEVLRLVGRHLQNSEIAGTLHLSERTVESHVSSLLRKLTAADRRGLLDAAQRLGDDREHALHQPLSTFVGREHELAELDTLAQQHRLITLVGPPGAGKSRLALQLTISPGARRLPTPALVDLATLPPGSGVVRAFADSLAVAVEEHRLSRQLRDVLAHGDHWLLVDNCEHVAGPTAALVDELVGTCPGLRVLATSHGPLGVAGEVVFAVAPLAPADAERLFLDRARSALPGFSAEDGGSADVAAICERLDGLPLAIELAAARLRTFSTAELLEQLEDRFALLTGPPHGAPVRHATLEAAIRWSHDLLDEDERLLLERCSVFPAAFDFDTVSEVLSIPPLTRDDVVRVFPRLLDRSLLASRRTGRSTEFRMLFSIRRFAGARLAERGDQDVVRRQHAQHHLRAGPARAADLRGGDQAGALLWFERRWPDVRAAMRWAIDSADLGAAWGFLSGIGTAWEVLGARGEAFDWLDELLAAPFPADDHGVEAAVTATLLRCYQDTGAALELAGRAVDLARDLDGDEHARALATMALGWASMYAGQPARARGLLDEAIDLLRRHGDEWHLAFCREGLGLAGCDLAETLEHLGRAADDFGRLGDLVKRSNCLSHMASACLDSRRRLEDAGAWLVESRRLAELAGSLHERLHAELGLARLDQLHGRPTAGPAFEALLPGFRTIGDLRCTSRCLTGLGVAALAAGDHAAASDHLAQSALVADGTRSRADVAHILRLLAECSEAAGDDSRAARLRSGAEAVVDGRAVAVSQLVEAAQRVAGSVLAPQSTTTKRSPSAGR